MTSEELAQIRDMVLLELKSDTVTIAGLPLATDVAPDNCVELDTGKRCTLKTIAEVTAAPEPNCVGRFSDDSSPDDWYWWPGGVKTALPVDPVTKRFSFYYPGALPASPYLFTAGSSQSGWQSKLIELERLPLCVNLYAVLSHPGTLNMLPVIDCSAVETAWNNRTCNYVFLQSSKSTVTTIAFKNTEAITQMEMPVNASSVRIILGVDFSAMNDARSWYAGNASYIQITNLGKRQTISNLQLHQLTSWGDDSKGITGARKSLVDSLLTNSFDRTAAGYDPVSITLAPAVVARLTDDEIAAITAKGFTLVSQS